MKKITVLFLLLVFVFSGCEQINFDKNISPETNANPSSNNVSSSITDNFQIQNIDPSQFVFSTGDGEIEYSVSKKSFTKSIECMYNGEKITIDTPKFTSIPVEAVYSYKKTYNFIDGYIIFDVATNNGLRYIQVDKNGTILAESSDLQKINSSRDSGKYMTERIGEQVDIQPKLQGTIIGNNVAKVQFGEPNNYTQYLYTLNGECISEGFDSIGYFFDGLALTVKDKKIGIIDEQGNVVLTPTIAFDTIVYPPTERNFLPYFITENAFIIPIDGEFAVINIHR